MAAMNQTVLLLLRLITIVLTSLLVGGASTTEGPMSEPALVIPGERSLVCVADCVNYGLKFHQAEGRYDMATASPGDSVELVDRSKGALLNIPPRKQWLNDSGYCGETTIQSLLLYFGGYASQDVIRKSVGGEVTSEKMEDAIDNFRLDGQRWQGKKHSHRMLVWMKKHLQSGHPLTGLVYITDMKDAYHLIPFIGYESADANTYNDDDVIVYNPLLGKNTNTIWQSFDGTVAVKGRCSYPFCISKEAMYMVAVSGNKDFRNETARARLQISAISEPNVSKGKSATVYDAVLYIYGLRKGERYAILRYDNYVDVPSSNFLKSRYSDKSEFTATGSIHSFTDRFPSNGTAMYRVVRADS